MGVAPSSELALWIIDCTCVCGHRWTHSHVTHRMGGTPNPQEEAHGTIVRLHPTRRQFNHCHRCVQLSLGIGWEQPHAKPHAQPPTIMQSLMTKLTNGGLT